MRKRSTIFQWIMNDCQVAANFYARRLWRRRDSIKTGELYTGRNTILWAPLSLSGWLREIYEALMGLENNPSGSVRRRGVRRARITSSIVIVHYSHSYSECTTCTRTVCEYTVYISYFIHTYRDSELMLYFFC